MRWTVPAFGLAAFAAALAALAPATLIDARLERASDGRLRLAGAQGSVWSGTGWLEIRGPDGRSGVAKHVAWRVQPASLLRGRLTAGVALDQAGKPFPVTLSLGRIEIAGAGISLPAAALGLGIPQLAPFRLSGEVRIDIPHFALERGRMDGDATLQWLAAGSALTPLSPLGDYELRFEASGAGMQAILRTLEGPLQLEGRQAWSNRGSNRGPPAFLVTARIPAQHQEQLSPIFRLIGVERGSGTFELQLK